MLRPRRIFCQLLVLFIVLFIVGCSPTYTPRLVEEREREDSRAFVDVLSVSQYPDYPTGCESVTAVMALRHAGVSTSVEDFIANHLLCDEAFYEENGLLYGPDPYEVFIGDPRRTNSYGCMAPVIEQALRSCVGEGQRVVNTTGETLSALCSNYVDNGIPVILWATMEMRPVGSGRTWFLPTADSSLGRQGNIAYCWSVITRVSIFLMILVTVRWWPTIKNPWRLPTLRWASNHWLYNKTPATFVAGVFVIPLLLPRTAPPPWRRRRSGRRRSWRRTRR